MRTIPILVLISLIGEVTPAKAADYYKLPDIKLLHKDLFVEANPIPVKWAVARMGLIGNAIRLPLVELSAAHHDTVLRAMRDAGVTLEDQAA
jgi:dihydrodipicolinate synthase/N-acetylneuraminate lyase